MNRFSANVSRNHSLLKMSFLFYLKINLFTWNVMSVTLVLIGRKCKHDFEASVPLEVSNLTRRWRCRVFLFHLGSARGCPRYHISFCSRPNQMTWSGCVQWARASIYLHVQKHTISGAPNEIYIIHFNALTRDMFLKHYYLCIPEHRIRNIEWFK